MPRRSPSAATTVFALVAVATIGAFAWSQQLKRAPLVLDHVAFGTKVSGAFTPNHDCRFDRIRIRFRVTRSDHANVQVIKPGGSLILTLARNRFLKRYTFFTFYWDGRVREDGVAPPGRYKLRVKLLGQGRTLVPPGGIRLHRTPRNPLAGCARKLRGSR